jgi:hypothetical protein
LAEYVELTIDQGATYNNIINVTDANGAGLDLTGYTVRSEMRKSYYSTTYYPFSLSFINAANGSISMVMSAANTASLSPGRYVYDVELEDNLGNISRIFEGIVTVLPNVTKS